MSRIVRAFVLGLVAGASLVYGTALAVGILADAGDWSSFRLAAGPIELIAFERTAAGTSTSFGPGLLVAALAIASLNALAGHVLVRRQAQRAG